MEWTDSGIVLSARRHGESAVILHLLTETQGRAAGLVRGGASSRQRGLYQPGNEVRATWRARLADHLGSFTCEPLRGRAAGLMGKPARLSALTAACAVAETTLPEREAHRPVYLGFKALLDALEEEGEDWPEVYVRWEIGLLRELGFGLDLDRCAATGRNDQLAYVSPKSGRAVSLSAAEPYKDKLLPLPAFLSGGPDRIEGLRPAPTEIGAALRLTGFFLSRFVYQPQDRHLPDARDRLAARFST